jgi:hypothetical protein
MFPANELLSGDEPRCEECKEPPPPFWHGLLDFVAFLVVLYLLTVWYYRSHGGG